MIHLFVIADDFTGALDTGVQFASYGAATKVVVGTGLQALEADAQTQVLVVDAETRHLPAAQAYDTVYRLVRWAKEKKIGCIYKKTDSALRGNIGAELSAALAADGGDRLHFVPAFPNLDRVTRGGVHYIGGVPVAQSVFGKDPFEPVTHSRVEDILHEQTDTLCAYIPGGGSAEGKAGVLVYEAQTNRDMAQIADRLAARSETGLLAGCAGFAAVLPGHRAAAALRPSARGLRQHQPGLAGAVRAGRGAGSAPLQPHAGAEALAGLGGRRAGGRNAGSCVTGLFAGAGGGAGHRRRGGERGRGQNRRPHPDRQYAGRAAQASAGRRAGEHGADHGR